ncbi:hypothetical protein MSG28_006865 [Choristoneura fumiferana]|nr:hypothetical protein MSG28_006865 [Choristoneura fumiferana]
MERYMYTTIDECGEHNSSAHRPIEFDPMCDKEKPQKISFEDERGARNAMILLSPEARQRGVISASLGNHSQGISYHAKLLKIPATVVMPNVAPIMKIQKCRSFGAEVVIHGHDMTEAKHHAMIIEQVPDVDAVLVPVGGGGLLAGTATAIKHLKPHVLIYGVESEKCASMTEAINKGQPESVDIRSTLADGLAVPTVGYNAYFTSKTLIDRMIAVPEDWIARAILMLVEQEKYVVEGGGAVGIAAIMAGLVPELAGKKVVCILSGGNIDTTILGRCLERGLAAESRLVKFKVTVSDRPGGIAELCKLIATIGVSIKDIIQERAWVCGDIFSVRVKVVCETRGPDHTDELRALIAMTYREWFFSREGDDEALRPCDSLDNDIDFDENCDPSNPRKIKYDDILAASRRIVGAVCRTSCSRAHMSDKLGMELYLKQEFLQHTGSFKERGVRNALMMLSEDQKKAGAIAATTGNHGMALAFHATALGIPCVVVMPQRAPLVKVNKCEVYGAKLILYGNNILEARHHALGIAKEKKMAYINGFDHPNVIEGQGSVGIEIIEQLPQVDAVLVPVGGGSLIAGIGVAIKHLKPDTEIYGIQTDKTNSMVEALRKNERVFVAIDSTIADGLAVQMVGVNAFHTAKGIIDKMVTVSDRPGGMAELCSLLSSVGVTLRDCIPERAWVKGDLKIIAETRGWDHTKDLIESVKKNYKEYYFQDMGDQKDKGPTARRGPCLAPNPVCMQK